MIKQRPLFVFLVGTILATPLVINADPVKKATQVTFSQPVEIPGMVLQPGTYVIKVPDPVTHADMVGFYNLEESHLYKLVRAIPKYRLDPTEGTVIAFEERAGNLPQAVKTWFYPGDRWGKEFVYGDAEMLKAWEEVPPLLAAPEPVVEAAPKPAAPEPVAEAAPKAVAEAPVDIVATVAPAPESTPFAPVEELPKTGTSLPLIALLGMCSLALGGLLLWLPKRAN